MQFGEGRTRESLGLTGEEIYAVEGLSDAIEPGQEVTVVAKSARGAPDEKRFSAVVRLDTPVEVGYYRHGGILQMVLRKMLAE